MIKPRPTRLTPAKLALPPTFRRSFGLSTSDPRTLGLSARVLCALFQTQPVGVAKDQRDQHQPTTHEAWVPMGAHGCPWSWAHAVYSWDLMGQTLSSNTDLGESDSGKRKVRDG